MSKAFGIPHHLFVLEANVVVLHSRVSFIWYWISTRVTLTVGLNGTNSSHRAPSIYVDLVPAGCRVARRFVEVANNY